MRIVLCFLALPIVASDPASVFGVESLAEKYPRLASLAIPGEALPPDCRLHEIPADVVEFKRLKNGEINTDPRLFLFADERLAKLVDTAKIEATYAGLYYQKKQQNDFGIVGWACTTEDDAKLIHAKMAEGFKDETYRCRLWQRETCVAWLWRDPGVTDGTFRRLEELVDARFAGNKDAAAHLEQGPKLDGEAKKIAEEFLKALRAEDVGAILNISQTPFYWDGKEYLRDQDALKAKWSGIFEEKNLLGIDYEIKDVAALMYFEQISEANRRILFKDIRLNDTDRIVVADLKRDRREDDFRGVFAVLIRIRDGMATVAGFSD